ncbi:MAG: hypothetical protein LBI99_03815 [Propionibacteriaceae bacterium]|nr:hypothetical protein [Propionibacteriaceae bacterium]
MGKNRVNESLGEHELRVEFAGNWYFPRPNEQFSIGRSGDIAWDDNPYLHRKFLRLAFGNGFWWVINDGKRLTAALSDQEGRMYSWLSPGSAVPLVFRSMRLSFSAGPISYELNLFTATGAFAPVGSLAYADHNEETIGDIPLTAAQKLLILALAENRLRKFGSGAVEIPSTAQAAERLGWTQTRFNRKLDNVCDKFDNIGVEGLRGDSSGYATNRRARLVEYAVSSALVTAADLPLLEAESAANNGRLAVDGDDDDS